jgi:hypothetical protein
MMKKLAYLILMIPPVSLMGQAPTVPQDPTKHILRLGVHASMNFDLLKQASLVGFYTSLDVFRSEKGAFGIASGFDILSRDSFTVYSLPFALDFRYTISKGTNDQFYLSFRPGLSLPLSADSKLERDTLDHPGVAGRKVPVKNGLYDHMQVSPVIQLGFGYESSGSFSLGFYLRNQPSNLASPFGERLNYFGISLGKRIR